MTLQHVYGTNGISDSFAFSFPVDQDADIQVLIDNVEQSSGYTVHGAASPGGGVVVFLAAPAAGKTVLIRHRGRVAVSSADASSGYLSDKLVAGGGISLAPTTDPEGRQTLVIASTGGVGVLHNTDIGVSVQGYNANAVTGPGASAVNQIPQWNGSDGKVLKAGLSVGTAAGNLVQLDGSARLPALDGSQLTNLPADGRVKVDGTDAAAYLEGKIEGTTDVITATKDSGKIKIGTGTHVPLVNAANNWGMPQRAKAEEIADKSGSVTPDFAAYQNFVWTLTGTMTALANPTLTSAMVGQKGAIEIIPGSYTTTPNWDTFYKRLGFNGGGLTMSSVVLPSSGRLRLDYHIVSTTRIAVAVSDVEA